MKKRFSNRQVFSVRLNKDLNELLDLYSQTYHVPKNYVVIKSIEKFLNLKKKK